MTTQALQQQMQALLSSSRTLSLEDPDWVVRGEGPLRMLGGCDPLET